MTKKNVAVAVLVVVAVLGTLTVAGLWILGSLLSTDRGAGFDAPGVLVLDLDAPVIERAPPDLFAAELVGDHLELLDLALALDRAATDDRIEGVLVKLRWPRFGWAKAEEIRRGLERFAASGKPLHAWTSVTNELGYYVASAADSIWTLPGADVEMNGFVARSPFVKRLLDKIGVDPQVAAIGEYKAAGDLLRRTDMSEPVKEANRALLETVRTRFVDGVVEARGVDRARLEGAMEAGVYRAGDLRTLGLVDGERHEGDLVRSMLGGDPGPDAIAARQIDVREYVEDLPDARGEIGGTIALVYATGTITGGESGFDPVFGETMGSETVIRMLRDVAADGDVDAVVLRIDSPGGDAFASEEMWAAVEELREAVPVVVSMSDVAASGGYYLASAADSIVAEPTTITGSIGVVAALFDLSGLWEKVGVDWDRVQTGPAADFPSTTRPLTEAERATFEGLVERTYRIFVDRVARGRGMAATEVDGVARGRVWSGADAAERGLVDRLGGLETAIDVAKGAAGIDPDRRVRLHVYPRRPTVLEQLRQAFRLRVSGARARGAAPLPSTPAGVLASSPAALELVRRIPAAGLLARGAAGRPLAVMPYTIEVR